MNENTNNRFTYKSLLEILNEKIINDFDLSLKKKENKLVLVCDNVKFHKTKEIIELLKDLDLNIMFTPPYSPDLNPVESAFSLIKRVFRQNFFRNR